MIRSFAPLRVLRIRVEMIMQRSKEELQVHPDSKEEVRYLELWAQTRIHWSAEILQIVVRPKGYLLEIKANPFSHPRWFGIDHAEINIRVRSLAIS